MKKVFRAAVAALLAVTLLSTSTGCNKAKKTSTDSKNEVTSFTVWTGMTGTALSPNNRMAKKVKKELGVSLSTEMLVGDKKTKIGTMIAGGTYDDILMYDNAFVKAGAMIPLEKYLTSDDYPNLKKHYAPYLKKMEDPNYNNHIYYMPNWNVNIGKKNNFFPNGTAFWIQKAVLKEAGYPKIKTPEQFFSVIESYMKKHPTINGKNHWLRDPCGSQQNVQPL
jgi:putative aldouronate transport system substrate-binding protein